MVFFTCSGCGESLKKAQVEKHRVRCHRSYLLTCIDCCNDFHGEEYQAHLKCVSENQKYGGQKYQPKENKGEVKQEKWFDVVQQAIDQINQSGDQNLKSLLEKIRNYPNIPRKEAKFKNFVANSVKERNLDLVTKAWSAIKSVSEKLQSTSVEPSKSSSEEKPSHKQEHDEKPKETNITNSDVCNNGLSDTTNREAPVKSKKRKKTNNPVKDTQVQDINLEKTFDEPGSKKVKQLNVTKNEAKDLEINSETNPLAVNFADTLPVDESSTVCNGNLVSSLMKSIIKKSLKDADNNELTLKKLKKIVARNLDLKNKEEKTALHAEIEAYLKKKPKKYATDGSIVRFAS